MNDNNINKAVSLAMLCLIDLMREKLVEIRCNLLKINDQKVLSKQIDGLKELVVNIDLNFNQISTKQKDEFEQLKKEYLLLISLYD